MFFRFVTSGEIRKRSEFFEPFILGLTNATVEQVCLVKRIEESLLRDFCCKWLTQLFHFKYFATCLHVKMIKSH